MAFSCISGGSECTGCGECMEINEDAVYTCACCDEDICEGDSYYEVDGETYCINWVIRMEA